MLVVDFSKAVDIAVDAGGVGSIREVHLTRIISTSHIKITSHTSHLRRSFGALSPRYKLRG